MAKLTLYAINRFGGCSRAIAKDVLVFCGDNHALSRKKKLLKLVSFFLWSKEEDAVAMAHKPLCVMSALRSSVFRGVIAHHKNMLTTSSKKSVGSKFHIA